MSYKLISFTLAQGVATITLNRPEVLNSFNRPMAQEMQEALLYCHNNPEVRALIITGTGRAFCSGQDLSEVRPDEAVGADLGDIVRRSYNPIVKAIRSLEKPVICAVNGVAAGAGANLALACDLVIAARDASFIQSFSKIGLIPDTGGTFFLPRLVGLARATALVMLADKISADEALSVGLIYKVVEPAKLMEEAGQLAGHLASQPTRGLALAKRALNASFDNDLSSQLDLEEELQREAGRTHDYNEGVRAFIEKRKPRFTGH